MSMVQQAIEVSAPLHAVYEQLAAFENYPRFMSGVQQVTPIGNDRTHWIMDLDGKRREFDAQITERSPDERVSWATMEGPLLAETITLRPMGETKTQVVAQLEADIAFLMPSDRHGQASLTKWLKHDLTTFKTLLENGELGGDAMSARAGQWAAQAKKSVSGGASPAAVAGRIHHRPPALGSDATQRDTDAPHRLYLPNMDDASAVGVHGAHDVDDMVAPGRRIAKPGRITGGAGMPASRGQGGSADIGARTAREDPWGDGMVNEEERGSAHDM